MSFRYQSERFKIDVGNYESDLPDHIPMKHLRIYTESPCQVDLWLKPDDVKCFMDALRDDEAQERGGDR